MKTIEEINAETDSLLNDAWALLATRTANLNIEDWSWDCMGHGAFTFAPFWVHPYGIDIGYGDLGRVRLSDASDIFELLKKLQRGREEYREQLKKNQILARALNEVTNGRLPTKLYQKPDDVFIDSDVIHPDWNDIPKCHSWKRYVSEELRDEWECFGDYQRHIIAKNAQIIADREEYE